VSFYFQVLVFLKVAGLQSTPQRNVKIQLFDHFRWSWDWHSSKL